MTSKLRKIYILGVWGLLFAGMYPKQSTPLPVLPAAQAFTSNLATKHLASGPNTQALAQYISAVYDKPLAESTAIVRITIEEAKKFALPPSLLLGMMAKESGFNVTAKNPSGATGLMQVIPRYHMEKLVANESRASFLNPRTNIRVAANILAEYLTMHGTLDKALRKYSGDSRGYIREVRANWQQFEKMGRAPHFEATQLG